MLEFYNELLWNFVTTDKLNENYPLSRHPRVIYNIGGSSLCTEEKILKKGLLSPRVKMQMHRRNLIVMRNTSVRLDCFNANTTNS